MRRLALLPISLLILAGCDGSGSSSSPQAAATCPETGPHACKAGETEPLYTFQWALNHVASFFSGTPDVSDGGLDLNVEPVHRQGIKGQGVNVLVLDSGVDFRNEDLAPNADPSLSRNLLTQTSDPFPSETELKAPESAHGTAVSGTILAAQNGQGVMGIAPRASLGAANLLDAAVVAIADAATLFEAYGGGDWSSKAHVINASYGKGIYAEPYEQGTAIDTAAIRSLKGLRAQKGIVFVKSAGNYFGSFNLGGLGFRCMPVGQARSPCVNPANDIEMLEPNVIAVAALNARGQRSSYSSAGPVVWITGMGGESGRGGVYGEGNGPVDGPTIFTTDISGCSLGFSQYEANLDPARYIVTDFMVGKSSRNGVPDNPNCDYTYMNGTSSAAPTISGVVALVLSANPDLSWRDVRDILRLSARKVDIGYPDRSPALGEPAYGALFDLTDHSFAAPGAADDIVAGATAVPLNLGWQTNGAGLEYSDWYGFGVPDTQRAVALAQEYARDPALGRGHDVRFEPFKEVAFWHKDTPRAAPQPGDDRFKDVGFPYQTVTQIATFPGGDGVADEFQVRLSQQNVCLGSVGIAVRSPAGTVSLLKQPLDHFALISSSYSNAQHYTVGSYAFYGEPAAGDWQILAVASNPDTPPADPALCSALDGGGDPRAFQFLAEARIIKQ
ncbi:S8 family serine peptidase [Castellaniella sp. S9]|uniref:S8 family serine peptidase n=1 Tax=Castellaniella sp. S9 TaxID=2993652 RepID=UPI0022B2E2E2|nr:S8 family serine peptidase [Castellaniella sp. S9]